MISKAVIKSINSILKPQALAIYLHGSQANNSATDDSDIDLAILTSKRLSIQTRLELEHQLSQISDKKIDLGVLSSDTDPLYCFQVIKNGKILYEQDRHERLSEEVKLLAKYYDEANFRDTINRMVDQRLGVN